MKVITELSPRRLSMAALLGYLGMLLVVTLLAGRAKLEQRSTNTSAACRHRTEVQAAGQNQEQTHCALHPAVKVGCDVAQFSHLGLTILVQGLRGIVCAG